MYYIITFGKNHNVAYVCTSPQLFFSLPLGGKESIEVCAAGVALCVLHGENISQDVVALTAGFVLTHQLGFEEGSPPPLQSLHPSNIRLNGQEENDKPSGNSIKANKESINHSAMTLGHLADSCHSGDFDFGV